MNPKLYLASLLLGLLGGAACRTPAPDPFLGNPNCPKSGNPVLLDAYFEHEGQRAYFCNQGCARDGARDPERWLEIVYPGTSEVRNRRCPVTGVRLDGQEGTTVRFQGRLIRVADAAAAEGFWERPREYARAALAVR